VLLRCPFLCPAGVAGGELSGSICPLRSAIAGDYASMQRQRRPWPDQVPSSKRGVNNQKPVPVRPFARCRLWLSQRIGQKHTASFATRPHGDHGKNQIVAQIIHTLRFSSRTMWDEGWGAPRRPTIPLDPALSRGRWRSPRLTTRHTDHRRFHQA